MSTVTNGYPKERTEGRRSALFCTYYIPQTDLDSASRRFFHLIEFLCERGWEVSVIAQNPADALESAAVLDAMGVGVHMSDQAESSDLLGRETFDLAVLCFWHVAERYLARLRKNAPGTRIIVDSGDLHFVRQARRLFATGASGLPGLLDPAYAQETIKELNVYAQADCVMTVSAKEADLVKDLCGDPELAEVVPDCEDLLASTVPFEQRRGMLFVGNFEHAPNVEAVRYLFEQILPRIDPAVLKRHPITVVGSNFHRLPEDLRRERAGVELLGWVPSLEPYLERACISIAPLLHGAGTKRKLIQSLTAGTPAVTTSIGVEGLPVVDGEHVFVGDTPDAFARRAMTLLNDPETWGSMAERGRERIVASHGREAGRARFLEIVDRVVGSDSKNGRATVEAVVAKKRMEEKAYHRMVGRLQSLVPHRVPETAAVAVVSRGDEELLRLSVRRAWHFPRTQEGLYSGDHPADSDSAIVALEEARAQGVEFLVLPSSAFWWLKYYEGWRRHLERNYPLVVLDPEGGALFDLRASGQGAGYELDPKIYDVDLTPLNSTSSAVEEISFADAVPPESRSGEALISVVIPTRDRAPYLQLCLESLAHQTLSADRFEVLVVSDGSTDATAEVCASFASRLPLRYLPIEHAGISVAKNHGTRNAAGWIVLFFDDDDVADPDLLLEHVRAHSAHPENELAVLGFTDWDRSLQVNDVMRFVTDVGHHLFSYHRIKTGDVLDFTYFWGGRASCKREMLVVNGLFDPSFRFGSEDIELAYRLSHRGFRVIYSRWARQHMIRELSFEQFCGRCERQGASMRIFSSLHPDPVVQRYCGVADAERRWRGVERLLPLKQEVTRHVEELLATREEDPSKEVIRTELWRLYGWCFDAYRLKGFAEAETIRAGMKSARVGGEILQRV